MTKRPKPKKKTPEELEAERLEFDEAMEAFEKACTWESLKEIGLSDAEIAEMRRKDEAKRKREEERRLAREAQLEERRRTPKSPIDAYYNHMEKCPYYSGTKERRAWKKENPTFEFNGITYQDHWSPQMSNSGKTQRWMGYLTGSDGNSIVIKDEHINNRRNDPKRNWGLPE
jgi:hypothetical protein